MFVSKYCTSVHKLNFKVVEVFVASEVYGTSNVFIKLY